jgi:hypothetical protein
MNASITKRGTISWEPHTHFWGLYAHALHFSLNSPTLQFSSSINSPTSCAKKKTPECNNVQILEMVKPKSTDEGYVK